MSKLLVLDFDGTMTDAEEEGAPYRKGYLEDMSILLGRTFEEIEELARRFQVTEGVAEVSTQDLRAQVIVAEQPNDNGWNVDGRIVAPAAVDPYLRMKPIAHRVMDHTGAFTNQSERARVLELLYKYNYLKTGTVFHPGARVALERLEGTATFVVTNSYPAPVRSKLESLGRNDDGSCSLHWLFDRVHGLAQKYALSDDLDAVPESMQLPGLHRPVYLRRQKYYTVLTGLMAEVGCGWKDLVVVGDIFELDLALPFAMGARVGLLANGFTPPYEREFLTKAERGRVLDNVGQIPEFAFGLQLDRPIKMIKR